MNEKERRTGRRGIISVACVLWAIGIIIAAAYYKYLTEDFITQKVGNIDQITVLVDGNANDARRLYITDKSEVEHIYSLLENTTDISADRSPGGEDSRNPNCVRSNFSVILEYCNGEKNTFHATEGKRFERIVRKWGNDVIDYGLISGANEVLWDYIFSLISETGEGSALEGVGLESPAIEVPEEETIHQQTEQDTVLSSESKWPNRSTPGSPAQGSAPKITEEEAERIAFKAAQKARNTVIYWSGADIKLRQIQLIQQTPNYVYPLEEIGQVHHYYEGQINLTTPLYEVWYEDANAIASSLHIFVDANTGAVIGGSYTSD